MQTSKTPLPGSPGQQRRDRQLQMMLEYVASRIVAAMALRYQTWLVSQFIQASAEQLSFALQQGMTSEQSVDKPVDPAVLAIMFYGVQAIHNQLEVVFKQFAAAVERAIFDFRLEAAAFVDDAVTQGQMTMETAEVVKEAIAEVNPRWFVADLASRYTSDANSSTVSVGSADEFAEMPNGLQQHSAELRTKYMSQGPGEPMGHKYTVESVLFDMMACGITRSLQTREPLIRSVVESDINSAGFLHLSFGLKHSTQVVALSELLTELLARTSVNFGYGHLDSSEDSAIASAMEHFGVICEGQRSVSRCRDSDDQIVPNRDDSITLH